ncbi:MAG: hypothetical protein AAFX53_12040 [Bacteroidota bacterium]
MKEILGRISVVLLIGLLLIKVSAFHVCEHHDTPDDSNAHCELCVLAIEAQQLDGNIPSTLVLDYTPPLVPFRLKTTFLGKDYTDSLRNGTLFSRPPPIVMA